MRICQACGAQVDPHAGSDCGECGRVQVPQQHPFYGTFDTPTYDFVGVGPSERVEASDLLIGAGIAYRWDDGFALRVPPDREHDVDVLFGHDEDSGDEDGSDEDGSDDAESDAGDDAAEVDAEPDEWAARAAAAANDSRAEGADEDADWTAEDEAARALANLYDAADRLLHHPSNEVAGADLADATGVVTVSDPPYGVNSVLWSTAAYLARQLLSVMDGDDAEDVRTAARALRDVLRDYV